jgi:hypothetical protein
VDGAKAAAIEFGESYIADFPSARLQAALPLIHASTHYAPLARTDAVLICGCRRRLTPNREPDLSALTDAARSLVNPLQESASSWRASLASIHRVTRSVPSEPVS